MRCNAGVYRIRPTSSIEVDHLPGRRSLGTHGDAVLVDIALEVAAPTPHLLARYRRLLFER